MSIQEKLSKAYAPLQRKLFDRQISLTGRVSDVIRLKVVENKYHDEEIQIVSSDRIEMVIDFPAEIPLFRFRNRNLDSVDISQEQIESNTSVYLYDILPIECYAKFEDKIERGDIIIVMYSDENLETQDLVLILRISEVLGSFNANSLVWRRFQCAPYNLTLTDEINAIIDSL